MFGEEILTVNPRRRKRRRSRNARRSRRAHSKRRRIANPRRGGRFVARRSRRRNPRGLAIPSFRGVTAAIIPAGTGAVGAIGLDVLLAYVPLPDMLRAGWGRIAIRIAGAIGLGFLARPLVGTRNAQLFSAGALTVIAYDVLRTFAGQTIGDKVKGLAGIADFQDYRLGAYMRPAAALPAPNGRLGAYMNPAPVLRTRQLAALGGFGYHNGEDY